MSFDLQKLNAECPVEIAVEALRGKWKILILYYLQYGKHRYNELLRLLPGISKKVLTEQLQELEACHVICREDYQENPPRVEYYLAPIGEQFIPILKQLYDWGKLIQIEAGSQVHTPTLCFNKA